MKTTVHVFDVDGTIIYGNSLLQLWLFLNKGFWRMPWQLICILPYIILNQNQKAKEVLLSNLFLNKSQTEIESIGQYFFEYVLKYKIRPKAVEKIIELNEKKIQTILLSASCDAWLKPLAAYLSANLICTELAYKENRFTGYFATPNCKGEEKIKRLLAKYPNSNYEFICYGDSKSDKKLQTISKAFYYRYF